MTGVSTLAQALGQIERIQDQQTLLNTLSNQLATGKKTQKFSGLDTNVLATQRARTDLSALQSYIDNITNAERRTKLTLSAIEQFQTQAEDFSSALVGLIQESAHQEGDPIYFDDPLTPDVTENDIIGYSSAEPDIDLETLKDLASNLYDYAVDLLNSQDGDRYLLSGADTSTPPIIDTGVLDSAIATQFDDWKNGVITNNQFIANLTDRTVDNGNPDALTDSVIGYSSTLSAGTAGKVTIRVDETTELDSTILANDNGFRDVIVALSYIKSDGLGPIVDHVEIDPVTGLPNVITEGSPGADLDEQTDNFYEIYNFISATVNKAIDNIDQQRFRLETVRAQIDQIKTNHEQEINILDSTIATIENVDINDVAVRINALQLQLEASFGVTARVAQLSLTNFL
ncbi:MAG: flagellin [Bdellovibrionales bacterium]